MKPDSLYVVPYKVGDIISFDYKLKNTRVKAVVTGIDRTITHTRLLTDYHSHNEEWDAGEVKSFNKLEMKNIEITH